MSTPTNPPAKHPPRERMPFHECYILIECGEGGEEHASFYSSPIARDRATLEAIWFGGPDPSHKEEAEHYLQELREKGSLSFEGDPPLRWRTLSDYIQEHTALLQEEKEKAMVKMERKARLDLYELELVRLKAWVEAYSPDLFKEGKPPYTLPESAAAAMGRHILGLLIADYEAAAQAARSPGDAKKGEKNG